MPALQNSFARSHRMLLYLLMALVLLVVSGVSVFYLAIVFILFLWSDNGDIAVPLRESGRSVSWVIFRLGLDVVPLTIAALGVWLFSPPAWLAGLVLLFALGFYILSRHMLGRKARRAQELRRLDSRQAF